MNIQIWAQRRDKFMLDYEIRCDFCNTILFVMIQQISTTGMYGHNKFVPVSVLFVNLPVPRMRSTSVSLS